MLPQMNNETEKSLFKDFDCIPTPGIEDFIFMEGDIDRLALRVKNIAITKKFQVNKQGGTT